MSIEILLSRGADNAKTTRELMQITGLSQRELRRAVQHERKSGAVIISQTSNGGGYYLPADKGEIERFHKSMQSRGRNAFAATKAAGELLKETEGQLSIDTTKLQGSADEQKQKETH